MASCVLAANWALTSAVWTAARITCTSSAENRGFVCPVAAAAAAADAPSKLVGTAARTWEKTSGSVRFWFGGVQKLWKRKWNVVSKASLG